MSSFARCSKKSAADNLRICCHGCSLFCSSACRGTIHCARSAPSIRGLLPLRMRSLYLRSSVPSVDVLLLSSLCLLRLSLLSASPAVLSVFIRGYPCSSMDIRFMRVPALLCVSRPLRYSHVLHHCVCGEFAASLVRFLESGAWSLEPSLLRVSRPLRETAFVRAA